MPDVPSWRFRVLSALWLLIAVGVVARAVWELIAPMLPALIALTILIGSVWIILGRRR
ncbi:hypothetical protein [Allorhizocola rhizosphaerae]|uniref:hypothetical protein n=1 Tax=Allorhizocola rhizosphaerae TaxID=1872709 RepID=UPI0013C34020|nr:hypothetical protein [Allorhizocola rhizosphaerae]